MLGATPSFPPSPVGHQLGAIPPSLLPPHVEAPAAFLVAIVACSLPVSVAFRQSRVATGPRSLAFVSQITNFHATGNCPSRVENDLHNAKDRSVVKQTVHGSHVAVCQF